MAKKPNKMGRIEADPKPKRNFHMKEIAVFIASVSLLVAGIVGTLKYQEFIDNTKAQGVLEYKIQHCNKFTNEDKSQEWYECDVKNLENDD